MFKLKRYHVVSTGSKQRDERKKAEIEEEEEKKNGTRPLPKKPETSFRLSRMVFEVKSRVVRTPEQYAAAERRMMEKADGTNTREKTTIIPQNQMGLKLKRIEFKPNPAAVKRAAQVAAVNNKNLAESSDMRTMSKQVKREDPAPTTSRSKLYEPSFFKLKRPEFGGPKQPSYGSMKPDQSKTSQNPHTMETVLERNSSEASKEAEIVALLTGGKRATEPNTASADPEIDRIGKALQAFTGEKQAPMKSAKEVLTGGLVNSDPSTTTSKAASASKMVIEPQVNGSMLVGDLVRITYAFDDEGNKIKTSLNNLSSGFENISSKVLAGELIRLFVRTYKFVYNNATTIVDKLVDQTIVIETKPTLVTKTTNIFVQYRTKVRYAVPIRPVIQDCANAVNEIKTFLTSNDKVLKGNNQNAVVVMLFHFAGLAAELYSLINNIMIKLVSRKNNSGGTVKLFQPFNTEVSGDNYSAPSQADRTALFNPLLLYMDDKTGTKRFFTLSTGQRADSREAAAMAQLPIFRRNIQNFLNSGIVSGNILEAPEPTGANEGAESGVVSMSDEYGTLESDAAEKYAFEVKSYKMTSNNKEVEKRDAYGAFYTTTAVYRKTEAMFRTVISSKLYSAEASVVYLTPAFVKQLSIVDILYISMYFKNIDVRLIFMERTNTLRSLIRKFNDEFASTNNRLPDHIQIATCMVDDPGFKDSVLVMLGDVVRKFAKGMNEYLQSSNSDIPLVGKSALEVNALSSLATLIPFFAETNGNMIRYRLAECAVLYIIILFRDEVATREVYKLESRLSWSSGENERRQRVINRIMAGTEVTREYKKQHMLDAWRKASNDIYRQKVEEEFTKNREKLTASLRKEDIMGIHATFLNLQTIIQQQETLITSHAVDFFVKSNATSRAHRTDLLSGSKIGKNILFINTWDNTLSNFITDAFDDNDIPRKNGFILRIHGNEFHRECIAIMTHFKAFKGIHSYYMFELKENNFMLYKHLIDRNSVLTWGAEPGNPLIGVCFSKNRNIVGDFDALTSDANIFNLIFGHHARFVALRNIVINVSVARETIVSTEAKRNAYQKEVVTKLVSVHSDYEIKDMLMKLIIKLRDSKKGALGDIDTMTGAIARRYNELYGFRQKIAAVKTGVVGGVVSVFSGVKKLFSSSAFSTVMSAAKSAGLSALSAYLTFQTMAPGGALIANALVGELSSVISTYGSGIIGMYNDRVYHQIQSELSVLGPLDKDTLLRAASERNLSVLSDDSIKGTLQRMNKILADEYLKVKSEQGTMNNKQITQEALSRLNETFIQSVIQTSVSVLSSFTVTGIYTELGYFSLSSLSNFVPTLKSELIQLTTFLTGKQVLRFILQSITKPSTKIYVISLYDVKIYIILSHMFFVMMSALQNPTTTVKADSNIQNFMTKTSERLALTFREVVIDILYIFVRFLTVANFMAQKQSLIINMVDSSFSTLDGLISKATKAVSVNTKNEEEVKSHMKLGTHINKFITYYCDANRASARADLATEIVMKLLPFVAGWGGHIALKNQEIFSEGLNILRSGVLTDEILSTFHHSGELFDNKLVSYFTVLSSLMPQFMDESVSPSQLDAIIDRSKIGESGSSFAAHRNAVGQTMQIAIKAYVKIFASSADSLAYGNNEQMTALIVRLTKVTSNSLFANYDRIVTAPVRGAIDRMVNDMSMDTYTDQDQLHIVTSDISFPIAGKKLTIGIQEFAIESSAYLHSDETSKTVIDAHTSVHTYTYFTQLVSLGSSETILKGVLSQCNVSSAIFTNMKSNLERHTFNIVLNSILMIQRLSTILRTTHEKSIRLSPTITQIVQPLVEVFPESVSSQTFVLHNVFVSFLTTNNDDSLVTKFKRSSAESGSVSFSSFALGVVLQQVRHRLGNSATIHTLFENESNLRLRRSVSVIFPTDAFTHSISTALKSITNWFGLSDLADIPVNKTDDSYRELAMLIIGILFPVFETNIRRII